MTPDKRPSPQVGLAGFDVCGVFKQNERSGRRGVESEGQSIDMSQAIAGVNKLAGAVSGARCFQGGMGRGQLQAGYGAGDYQRPASRIINCRAEEALVLAYAFENLLQLSV